MVALPQVFNTADLQDVGGGLPNIPPGQYKAVIVASELKATKNNMGQYIALTVVLIEGQHKDTEFTERLNIVNQNETAVKIAFATLARISEAVGMTTTPQDTVQLHNKPFLVEIVTAKGQQYTDKTTGELRDGNDYSEIKKYLPLPSVGIQQPVQQQMPAFNVPQAQQQNFAPQQQQQMASPQPAAAVQNTGASYAAASGGNPPWMPQQQ